MTGTTQTGSGISDAKKSQAEIRKELEEKGYSIQIQAKKTKALADTFNIKESRTRDETIKKINSMGRHLLNDIRGPKDHSKKDSDHLFVEALVAVSTPKLF